MKDLKCHFQSIPNGETIAYRSHGRGAETLVLVHGNVSTSFFWERFMKRLPKRFRAIAVDLRGAGKSSYNRPVEHMAQFSEDIAFLLEALKIERCHLIGLSMGGLVCQQLAADHPELIATLSLIDSPSCQGFPVLAKDAEGQIIPGQFWANWSAILNDPVQVAPMRSIMESQNPELIKKVYEKTVFNVSRPEESYFTRLMEEALSCRNYPDCLWPMHIFNLSPDHNGVRPGNGQARHISMPVLIIYGEQDILVPPAIAELLAQQLGDHTEMKSIPAAGHIPFIDNEEAVLAAVLAFVDRFPTVV